MVGHLQAPAQKGVDEEKKECFVHSGRLLLDLTSTLRTIAKLNRRLVQLDEAAAQLHALSDEKWAKHQSTSGWTASTTTRQATPQASEKRRQI